MNNGRKKRSLRGERGVRWAFLTFLHFTFMSLFGFIRRCRHYTSGGHQVNRHDADPRSNDFLRRNVSALCRTSGAQAQRDNKTERVLVIKNSIRTISEICTKYQNILFLDSPIFGRRTVDRNEEIGRHRAKNKNFNLTILPI